MLAALAGLVVVTSPQPISSAAWRLPPFGTFSPVLWQVRQRFSDFPPLVALSKLFFTSAV